MSDQASADQKPNPPDEAALAGRERLSEQVARTGMFGTETTGDTSGYGGLIGIGSNEQRTPVGSGNRTLGELAADVEGLRVVAVSDRLPDLLLAGMVGRLHGPLGSHTR